MTHKNSIRILILDHDPESRRRYERIPASRIGATIEIVETIDEARARIMAGTVDLVVCDDAVEARALALYGVRVVIVTSDPRAHSDERLPVFVKPVLFYDLVNVATKPLSIATLRS